MRFQKINLTAAALALAITAAGFAGCISPNTPTKLGDVSQPSPGEQELAKVEGKQIDDDLDGCADSFEHLQCKSQQASAFGGQAIPGDGFAPFIRPICQHWKTGAVLEAAPEECDNLDNDCDGLTDENQNSNVEAPDADKDGQADCFDTDDDNDGIDDDAGDCAPFDAKIRPGLDEVCDGKDNNCDSVTDPENSQSCTIFYQDGDGDGFGNKTSKCLCAADVGSKLTAKTDGDCDDTNAAIKPAAPEVCDGVDNDCNNLVDENQGVDTDMDGAVDCFDTDDDGDGVADTSDNCMLVVNTNQVDTDKDGQGDGCDADDDNDGVLDGADNCPLVANTDQKDVDADGLGDGCDLDADADGVLNTADNCVFVANNAQTDTDKDGKGDACEDDDDNDGVLDIGDNCPTVQNGPLAPLDAAGKPTSNQLDTDGDKAGDACDADDDNDGVNDTSDNCPLVANTNQADTDGDKKGDACEDDTDGDGDPDATDCNDANSAIKHGASELCDGVDNDCDGKLDNGFPDTDKDGIADCVDLDTDNDGDPNATDCKPLDPKINSNVKNDECDGVDNDCDTEIDESPNLTAIVFYMDTDKDGFGLTGQTWKGCVASAPFTALKGGDCNDGVSGMNPGATDTCGNGLDEDCSGADATCGCVPSCTNKVCGSNGCGGSCGNCEADEVCAQDQKTCTPLFETGLCGNGLDDDKDGKVDCLDNDCSGVANCGCTAASQCDDGNVCTTDSCTAATGLCAHANNTLDCTDGKPCTSGDKCSAGTCTPTGTTDCNDNNGCTVDSCDAAAGCKHVASSAPGCITCTGAANCAAGQACDGGLCAADLHGQTLANAGGANGGPLPDGTGDARDNDGDGYCETAPCASSADPSRTVASLLGGDCDDNPSDGGQFSVGCASGAAGCGFATDGSWGNNPGVTDFPGDKFDNNCDGTVQ